MNEIPVPVRVQAQDPISEIGVLTQLRQQPGVVIVGPDMTAAVVLAIIDGADEQALCWLKALRAEGTPDRLARAVRSAAAGQGDLPPELIRHLIDHMNQLTQNLLNPRGLSFAGLTARERSVLQLVADGLSTREVATHLAYSERTIKNVIQDLTIRLNVRNRTQAVAYAVRNGWI